METQKLINKTVSTAASVREQLQQEIEQAPDEILVRVLEFLLFLKSRYSPTYMVKQPPSTAGSILKTLERIGKWEGDDLDECLELVHRSRGKFYVTTDDNEAENLKAD